MLSYSIEPPKLTLVPALIGLQNAAIPPYSLTDAVRGSSQSAARTCIERIAMQERRNRNQ
jgi:hypothetical protein